MPKATQKSIPDKKKETIRKKVKRKKKLKSDGIPVNPWSYAETVPLLPEMEKIDVKGLESLECRSQYQISVVKLENEKAQDNELFYIFGSMMNQDAGFMSQWIRVYMVTHRKTVSVMAKEYLDGKGLTLHTWLNGLKEGRQADVLGLFLLCLATQMHSFVHLNNGYWTTLRDSPNNHLELIQRCNVHLSYLGRGIFIEHVLRLNTSYEIFGINDQIDMLSTSTVIGEFNIEESEVLKALLSLGTCVISKTGGPVLNPATPTIPTTEPLHVESGSLANDENTGISKNPMPEPSVSVPSSQCIPMEEWPQTESVSVSKNPMPGPSANKTCTSTSSEGTKKHKALSCVQIQEILNN